ncbi:ParA family protein, partial [Chryseobacterium sp.]|uniref:ParA family protein n=2 Tax=Chryseobacterium TaxID=59732 RepID=UPI0028A00329
MIITFGTQKGGTGKTTLAIAFANYVAMSSERKVNVFDFDFQKSFYHKWKEDELLEIPKLYDVEIIDEENEQPFSDFEHLIEMKESEDVNVFDL